MGKKKKLIILLSALVCVIAMGVGTTVAYITSFAGPVRNTFTIGEIELSLGETTGMNYQLIPGTTIKKDPHVTVGGGSEDCWLFFKITKTNNPDTYLEYSIADGWFPLLGFENVYYRSLTDITEDVSIPIISNDTVKVKSTLTEQDLEAITANPKLTFTAYAVQSHGIDDAATAYNAILMEE